MKPQATSAKLQIVRSPSDGIPDGWEIQYLGSTAACHPHVDSDGDGQTTIRKWIGGSDTTDPRSTFATSSIALAVLIYWPTLPNRRYDLYWSENLAGSRQILGNNMPHNQNTYSDSFAAKSSFYQVRVKLE